MTLWRIRFSRVCHVGLQQCTRSVHLLVGMIPGVGYLVHLRWPEVGECDRRESRPNKESIHHGRTPSVPPAGAPAPGRRHLATLAVTNFLMTGLMIDAADWRVAVRRPDAVLTG